VSIAFTVALEEAIVCLALIWVVLHVKALLTVYVTPAAKVIVLAPVARLVKVPHENPAAPANVAVSDAVNVPVT
jgi:hypothetical protein